MGNTAQKLFGSQYTFGGWQRTGALKLRVFVKLPKSTKLPPAIEVHPDYFDANLHAYCADQILFIGKSKGPDNDFCDNYCVLGEIEGLDPVPIASHPQTLVRNRPLTS
jgi:hypothetical protein